MVVALYHYFPPAVWNRGGGELHFERSLSELIAAGCDAVRFQPHDPPPNIDILHIFGSNIHVADLAQSAKAVGLRVVVSTIAYSERANWQWRGARILERLGMAPTAFRLRRAMFRSADALVTSSGYELAQVCERYGANPLVSRVVKVGVDPTITEGLAERFLERYPVSEPFVLHCGRVSHHKGQLRTIAAARRLGVSVVIVGGVDPWSLEYGQRVQAEVRSSDDVHWLGKNGATPQLIADAYAACAVHVLPSISECPGLVNLEAAAVGKPVVTGRYPPLVEYLGEAGCYVNPMSIRSIANGIEAALSDPDMGNRSREAVRSLSWKSAAQELIRLYDEVSLLRG